MQACSDELPILECLPRSSDVILTPNSCASRDRPIRFPSSNNKLGEFIIMGDDTFTQPDVTRKIICFTCAYLL